MSNPTSNFGWQMPTATDLVTDLPADFEVFGQAVDTDLADLNGGTTGQVLSKTSGTDLDFTWVDPTAGDITGVTAGTGMSGGGTSGTVTVTNSMATAIDAKGDLIAGTADDTFSRLAVGANDTVLIADSAEATGLKWGTPSSGGMTVLASGSITNTALSLTSISQSYTNLVLYLDMAKGGTPASYGSDFRLNNDTSAYYNALRLAAVNGSFASAVDQLGTSFRIQSDFYRSGEDFQAIIQINQYTSANAKIVNWYSIGYDNTNYKPLETQANGQYVGTAAITEIQTINTALTGSYILYGVK